MAKQRTAEALWIDSRGRWQVNVQRDGKRKTFTSSTPGRRGKREAEAKADDWLDAGQPDDMRFDAAWAEYLKYIQSTTGTANYSDHESIGRVWILPHLGGKRLSKIRKADLQGIITKAADMGRARKTCENIRGKISGFYIYAHEQKWDVDKYIAEKLKIPSKAPKGTRNVVQPEQIRIVFEQDTETCRNTTRPCFYIHAFRFLIVSGLRAGELCGAKRSDIDGDALIISRCINRHDEVRQGKNDNALRIVPLTSYAKKIISDQLAMLDRLGIESAYLFPNEDGNHSHGPTLYKRWVFFAKQHSIETSIHELRHTFVSMTQNALPKELLKRIVGHSAEMDTGGIYGHEMDGDLQDSRDILEASFAKFLGS